MGFAAMRTTYLGLGEVKLSEHNRIILFSLLVVVVIAASNK